MSGRTKNKKPSPRHVLPGTCPRCDGTMLPTQRDSWGEFRECLTCGYFIDRLIGPPISSQPQRVGIRPRRNQMRGAT